MKRIKIFLPILAIIFLAACTKDVKEMIIASPVAPNLSAPSQNVAPYNADSGSYVLNFDSVGTAISISGTAADYGQKTPVSYTLQIDFTSDNFQNAQTLAVASTNSFTVSIKQLYAVITNADGLNATTDLTSSFDLRVMTTIGVGSHPTYSNAQTVKLKPLAALLPFDQVSKINLWYIIGMGDHNWTYSDAGIGVSMIPLGLETGNAYNKSGDGLFTYTGYFQASVGFKIVSGAAADMGTWKNQWGSSDGALTPVYMDGSSQNFFVPADGYYTIKLNSVVNTLTIEPAASAPSTSYSAIGLIGEFNGWASDVDLSPCDPSAGTNNHMWYTTYTFSTDFTPPVGNGGCKFRANHDWGTNWGSGVFPFGFGVGNGTNIPYLAGTYHVILNDVTGCYYFIEQTP